AGRGRAQTPAAADQPRVAEDGHPRVELRQRHLAGRALPRAVGAEGKDAGGHQAGGRAGLRRADRVEGSTALLELRRADGVRKISASNATPAWMCARWTASRSRPMATRPICARA